MRGFLLAFALLSFTGNVVAQGQSTASRGAVLGQTATGAYESLPEKPTLAADRLYLLLPDVVVQNAAKSVTLVSRADFLGMSPLPILETAITLKKSDNFALDFTLNRGRVELRSTSDDVQKVHVTIARQNYTLTLSPSAKVLIETASRWPSGTEFRLLPPEGYEPTSSSLFLVLSGTATLASNTSSWAMVAPPGLALVEASSTDLRPAIPQKLDKLPAWADDSVVHPPDVKAQIAAMKAALNQYRTLRNEDPVTALDKLLESANPTERRVGLIAAGAEDDLNRIAKGIIEAKEVEVWDTGIAVLRHWLGRGPGQEQKFHRFLLDVRQYSTVQSMTIFKLVNGFTPDEARRPETFDVLIEYLRHEKPVYRNLAAWHLVRLAPAGSAIPFRPNASKIEFDALYKKWRELIPPGQLPKPSKS
jgi:hypothetical protein